jgi:hypothetical protein
LNLLKSSSPLKIPAFKVKKFLKSAKLVFTISENKLISINLFLKVPSKIISFIVALLFFLQSNFGIKTHISLS